MSNAAHGPFAFLGFEELDAWQKILVENVFDHLSAEDKHLARNQFFQRFGKNLLYCLPKLTKL